MRKTMIALFLLASTMPSFSQPANSDAKTPAINTPSSTPNPGAPVSGANSFTEGQAKSRLEANGYSNVSGLTNDDAGVWRGKANKGTASMSVSVDFQGNVVAQ